MTSDNIVEISSETLEGNFYHFDQHKNESTHLSFSNKLQLRYSGCEPDQSLNVKTHRFNSAATRHELSYAKLLRNISVFSILLMNVWNVCLLDTIFNI